MAVGAVANFSGVKSEISIASHTHGLLESLIILRNLKKFKVDSAPLSYFRAARVSRYK